MGNVARKSCSSAMTQQSTSNSSTPISGIKQMKLHSQHSVSLIHRLGFYQSHPQAPASPIPRRPPVPSPGSHQSHPQAPTGPIPRPPPVPFPGSNWSNAQAPTGPIPRWREPRNGLSVYSVVTLKAPLCRVNICHLAWRT